VTVIERDEVLRLARLARLALEPAEVDRLRHELEAILGHVDVMRELDLHDTPPYSSAVEHAAPLRSDTPGADALAQDPAAMAPAWRDGFYTLPRLETHRHPERGT
jgi:aspartyl-tRNA(Asn)/glutamyl-tRNA(Gln) amidotransferase subunit C